MGLLVLLVSSFVFSTLVTPIILRVLLRSLVCSLTCLLARLLTHYLPIKWESGKGMECVDLQSNFPRGQPTDASSWMPASRCQSSVPRGQQADVGSQMSNQCPKRPPDRCQLANASAGRKLKLEDHLPQESPWLVQIKNQSPKGKRWSAVPLPC